MTIKTNKKFALFCKFIGYVILFLLVLFVLHVFYQFTQDFPEFTWQKPHRTSKEVLDDWKNTASIVNGFLSPLLLLGSVILLWLTWRTSKKELLGTRLILSSQLKSINKKDHFDNISRKSMNLNNLFNKSYKLKSGYDSPMIANQIVIEITKLQEDDIYKIYKSLGFDPYTMTGRLISLSKVSEDIKSYLDNLEFSNTFLLTNALRAFGGSHHGTSTSDYLKENLKKQLTTPKAFFENIISLDYLINYERREEVKCFYKLIEEIDCSDTDYKYDLKFQFNLTFDYRVAKILIELNKNLNNDILEI
ncbi:hypothetical protein NQU96_11710 [Pseudoalteromonas elyakovii]|nr:hypothetical protein [Pseudoalteromonas elyakovii]